MAKVPGKVGFDQPAHGTGATTSTKNKGNLGFKQPAKGTGGTSSAKNKGKVGFTQPDKGQGGTSSKKNAGNASFTQPNRAGKTASLPKSTNPGKVTAKAGKVKMPVNVAPKTGKMGSVDDLLKYRKKKFGV